MIYSDIKKGTFLVRLNRFIAQVLIDGEVETVHVKNTGRCKELFIEGAIVFLQQSNNPKRKTKYSLISIYKGDMLINIDSQVPNTVVFEALQQGQIPELTNLLLLQKEVTYGSSRFDLYYEREGQRGFIEVKGVTLENSGIASFPDAPTTRGRKHILELTDGMDFGYQNYIFFLIQMDNVLEMVPNQLTDSLFTQALIDAKKRGVTPLVYNCTITENSIYLKDKGQLILPEK